MRRRSSPAISGDRRRAGRWRSCLCEPTRRSRAPRREAIPRVAAAASRRDRAPPRARRGGGRRGVMGHVRVRGIHLTPPASPAGAGSKRAHDDEPEDEATMLKKFRTAEALLLTPSPGAKPPANVATRGPAVEGPTRRTRGRPTRRTRTPTPTPTLSRTTWRWTRCPRLRPRGRAA